MIDSVNINIIQYVGIAGSGTFLFFIISLIRKQRIKEEYSLLWLFFAFIFLILSIWRGSIEVIALTLGIAYAPAAIFIMLFVAVISILIHYSVVVSRQSEIITQLVQEVGLLKSDLNKQVIYDANSEWIEHQS